MNPTHSPAPGRAARILRMPLRWIDASRVTPPRDERDANRIDWGQAVPFALLHVGCLAVVFVGWSPIAVAIAIVLYVVRMFAITGFYHRYFAHRTFRASRFVQFLLAVVGNSAVQRGPLWWASHHRNHHRHADQDKDAHSPRLLGFLRSHMLWFLTKRNFATQLSVVPDLARYRELRFLDRFDIVVPMLLAGLLFLIGAILERTAPSLGTSGAQLLVFGFCISTVAVYHATYTINSLSHLIGRRRYATSDDSRNNWVLALITFGEGWHNNHHHYCASARQGFFWWEIDLTYYGLRLLAWLGMIRDLRPVPLHAKLAHRASHRPTPDRPCTTDSPELTDQGVPAAIRE